jgi:hypothetical protein
VRLNVYPRGTRERPTQSWASWSATSG